jgi:tagatose-6-phosphate ketose/aldose isomerase
MNSILEKEALGLAAITLQQKGGYDTAFEIAGQPELWKKVYSTILEQKVGLRDYIKSRIKANTRIILTGAGSSAFIGIALQGSYHKFLGVSTMAIPTTDLISHPLDFINPDGDYLVLSFARSGDSPESVGAVEIINQICPSASHLIITCNENGKLAKSFNGDSFYKLILPSESNDKGLAMTGSFTSMLLSGIIIAKINTIENLKPEIDVLCEYGSKFISQYLPVLDKIARFDFERAVFLGSGPLFGCATESHLKLQELTNGQIICKQDSYLGFRHGPKAIINPKTLVVALMSNNSYVNKYESDMIRDISNMNSCHFLIISESKQDVRYSNNEIFMNETSESKISEDFLPVCFVLPAQIIGFLKAINLNIPPDSPSLNGAISRVVEGVVIYPYSK